MSEKKKPWAVRSVFGNTIDELASRLEDALNEYEEKGFTIRLDEMSPDNGFGYLIIGRKEEQQESGSKIHVVDLRNIHGNSAPDMKPVTYKFLESLVEGVPQGDWATVEKNAPRVIPNIIGKYTSTDISAIADDLESKLKMHAEGHDGNPTECPFHKALTIVSKILRERVNLHIS